MRLAFCGACREVTGSNILLETAGKKILLDCGVFQGVRLSEERNYSPFPYNPKEIDSVIVGHAHLDHTGRLPKLIKEGFTGRIYATAPTVELTRLVLKDSAKLAREEARRNHHPPLFTEADIERTMQLFEAIGYNETLEIAPNIKLTLKNAGHILGSAISIIESEGKKLVYTSDLGNNPSALLDPPAIIETADYVICESTYGARSHEDPSRRTEKLTAIINDTIAQSGVLMIPTFAIERTQELLYDIEHFCTLGNCQKPQFFLDSPLAQKVTEVFKKYPEYLSQKINNKNSDFFGQERIKLVKTPDESKTIYNEPNPKVIIAGAGMLNGGRILFHLRDYLPDSKNTLLIVGYQMKGGLGRRLLDGAKTVKILGQKIEVLAKVESIRSYSAHADLPQIKNWLSKINNLKKVFIIHGEAEQSLTLLKCIEDELKIEATAPQMGESYGI